MNPNLETEKQRAKSRFTAYETTGKRENKKCVCVCVCVRVCALLVHILGCTQRLSTQLPACVPANERSLPIPQHVCPMKGERLSCLYFPQKSAMMSPWTHLELTSVKKHYSSPPSLSLSPSFSVPPLPSSSRSVPASPILNWAPILFHISVFFNISPHPSMSPLFFSSPTLNHFFFSFWQAWTDWITKTHCHLPKMPGCSDYHKLCLSCGFAQKKMLRLHEGRPENTCRKEKKSRDGGECKWKRGEGKKRGQWRREGWWGQREGSQRSTYGSDSVITANLWAQKERSSFPCLFLCT